MVFLDHGQNLHIHAVRANILMSFSVDFRSDRLIWPVCCWPFAVSDHPTTAQATGARCPETSCAIQMAERVQGGASYANA